eukprot:NODE_10290_length_526_cov_25.498759_g9643_i0.p1 GENE.NODE_10290_length_526_cov_25.498759_g9643_i0~~NODE_10290_length_526_cov_25.498759_g9643_i0.p1  ORF type:complete len:174 (-),score=43.24 NODE_10290_length_526_cov_25.498759_g9643_i0:3-494(-)
MKDTILIVGMAGRKSIEDCPGYDSLPNNIRLFTFVPQIDLLPYCSLFITHGGANSVNESLYFSVPLIVIPFFGDQLGNGKQIQEVGLGWNFPLDEEVGVTDITRPRFRQSLTKDSLQSSIHQILCSDSIRDKVNVISKELKEYDGINQIYEIITSFYNEHKLK